MTSLLPWMGVGVVLACAILIAQRDELRSVAERSGFTATSRYDDVRAFIDALAARTPRVRIETFGTSEEGRALPLLVLGDPPAPTPAAAGVPVVLVMANIHAGEVEGKEALLHLARRLTTGDLQSLLRSTRCLFVPIYNADGNERISVDNRSEQNGPIHGVGTRENAKGLDLNRDFMKLESAEARALVGLLTRWDPDVVVDLHTTNGSYHGYHLTYAPTLNPNADARLLDYMHGDFLPAVREAVARRHHFRLFDYGNFAHIDALEEELEGFAPDDTRPKTWRSFDERPRFGNNYIGLRNRIAILSEAYSYLDFEGRVKVTEAFVEEILRLVAARAPDIRALTREADRNWSRSGPTSESGITFALKPLPLPVDVLVGSVGSMLNPLSKKPMRTMTEVATPTRMTVYDRFAVTDSRRVPREYIVHSSSPGLVASVERVLRQHGIQLETTTASLRRTAVLFAVDRVTHAERVFQGHHETTVAGHFDQRDIDIPAGSLIVRTDQPLGRLVFYLLEPESNDSLATWNLLDADLEPGKVHPVSKIF